MLNKPEEFDSQDFFYFFVCVCFCVYSVYILIPAKARIRHWIGWGFAGVATVLLPNELSFQTLDKLMSVYTHTH